MSHTAARPSLRVERDEHVAHLILTGPGKGNAMGPHTWDDIPAALDELEADAAIHALVISGHGEHFSYGLDLGAAAASFSFGDAHARRAFLTEIEHMQRAFTRIAESRLPVIAAIQGWCIGSGVELIAACDLRYAHAGAKFSLREVQLAIVADLGGLQRLPYIVGDGHARELALTGKTIDAAHAAQIGLVNEVVDDVVAHTLTVAREIASLSSLTTGGVKRVMNESRGKTIDEGLAYAAAWNAAFLQSADLTAAFERFRRP
jgi:enoyl-CoA hydratase